MEIDWRGSHFGSNKRLQVPAENPSACPVLLRVLDGTATPDDLTLLEQEMLAERTTPNFKQSAALGRRLEALGRSDLAEKLGLTTNFHPKVGEN